MRIRKVKKSDFFLFNEMDWSPLPKERDSIYLFLSLDQSDCSYVAEENGKFCGVILCTRSADGNSIYINHILVDKKFRNRGTGKKLIARLESYAKRAGVKRIWLMCQDELIPWYEALGYHENYSFLTPEIKKYLRQVKKVHALIKSF